MLLEELFKTTPNKITGILEHLRITAEKLTLPFGARTLTFNSRFAQELGLWAEDQGKGQAFHLAAFRAYFVDGQNLAKLPVLLDLARHVGLPEEMAKEVLEARTYQNKVDEDWQYARVHGITAVPTLIMAEHRLVGAQDYETLAEMVTMHGAERRGMNIVKGDLVDLALQGRFEVVIHGCNCFCTMAAGVAKVIQEEFPEAYAADLVTIKGDRNKLGDFSFATVKRHDRIITIVNGYTQFHFHGQEVLVDYEAIRRLFQKIKRAFSGKRIGYPMIGAGLGGGDWQKISAIIDEELAGEDHCLVQYSS